MTRGRLPELGVNISNSSHDAAADCALAAQLGARWVRVSIEGSDPASTLTIYRKACDDHGLQLFQTCQPDGHKQPRTQADIDGYATRVTSCAVIADATGRDNENNGYGSNETPDPKASATSMVACLEARDKHAPGRILVTDELCPGDKPVGTPLGKGYVDPVLFITAYLDAQPTIAKARKIWFGWHGYCDFRRPATTAEHWNTCWCQRQVATIVRARRGADGRITSSEFGAATAPPGFAQTVSPADQAQRFLDYMTEARLQSAAGVKHAPWIWYQLRDRTPANSSDWPAGCGLVDVHGNPKPVAAQFSAAAKVAA